MFVCRLFAMKNARWITENQFLLSFPECKCSERKTVWLLCNFMLFNDWQFKVCLTVQRFLAFSRKYLPRQFASTLKRVSKRRHFTSQNWMFMKEEAAENVKNTKHSVQEGHWYTSSRFALHSCLQNISWDTKTAIVAVLTRKGKKETASRHASFTFCESECFLRSTQEVLAVFFRPEAVKFWHHENVRNSDLMMH